MSKYPQAYYRVSAKAVVRNQEGFVLLVKEASDTWILPGGGIDHGETLEQALGREVYEELGIEKIESFKFLTTQTLYSPKHEAWFMWIVFNVEIPDYQLTIGSHVKEARFFDVGTFKGSNLKWQKRIYEVLYNN